jgi:hypothetical protein
MIHTGHSARGTDMKMAKFENIRKMEKIAQGRARKEQ